MLSDSSFQKGRTAVAGIGIVFILLMWSRACCIFAYTSSEANTIAVYDSVAPSVVNITTEVCEPEFFFCSVPSESGSASGIVLREDGTIVTNHHVIADARTIQVTVADGRRLSAEIIASSPVDDVAIIRVDVGDRPLKAIRMGDSSRLEVGEKVLAIGNPFGLGQSLSVGTVSMLNRSIKKDGLVLRNLIQTDAAINPGSSGGAMVNSRGELVGMNTMILSPTGSSIRIGFAIPANRIQKLAPGLMHAWEKWTGWLLAILLLFWIGRRIYLLK